MHGPGVPGRGGVLELHPPLPMNSLALLLAPALLHLSRWPAMRPGAVLWPRFSGAAGGSRKPESSPSCLFSGRVPMALMDCPLTPIGLLRFPHQQK